MKKLQFIKDSEAIRADLGLQLNEYGMYELYGVISAKLEILVNSDEQGDAFKAEFLRVFKDFVK